MQTLVSARLFEPSQHLIELLRARASTGGDEILELYDAFLLDPGLGPSTYLTSDGRIVWDDAEFWGVRGTRAEAFAAVVVGAEKTGIGALRSLLPARHAGGIDCNSCSATGWYDMQGQLRDLEGKPFSIVCSTCAGLGWIDDSIVLMESVLEVPRA